MRFKKTLVVMAVLTGAALYASWPGENPDLSDPVDLHLTTTNEYGDNEHAGNIVGISPVLEPLDYATPARFTQKIEGYLKTAESEGWLSSQTIVLLPEHIGTGLLFTNQGSRSYQKDHKIDAMLPIISANLFDFAKNLLVFDDEDGFSAAFIRTTNQTAANAQKEIYASLAKKYGVWIVSGSSSIMTPGVYPDGLSYGHGPIFNAGFVFAPDGNAILDATRATMPDPMEAGYTKAALAKFLPVYEVAGKKVGVLIGKDAHSEHAIDSFVDQGIEIALAPNRDTDPPQPELYQNRGIAWGMGVTLKGSLWGRTGNGTSWVLRDGTLTIEKSDLQEAALLNLWLPADVSGTN